MPTLQFIDIFSYEMSIDNYNSTEATGIHPSTSNGIRFKFKHIQTITLVGGSLFHIKQWNRKQQPYYLK